MQNERKTTKTSQRERNFEQQSIRYFRQFIMTPRWLVWFTYYSFRFFSCLFSQNWYIYKYIQCIILLVLLWICFELTSLVMRIISQIHTNTQSILHWIIWNNNFSWKKRTQKIERKKTDARKISKNRKTKWKQKAVEFQTKKPNESQLL